MRLLLLFLPFLLLADAHIFLLHRIGDNRYPSTNTPIKELEKYLKYVKSHNFKAIKLSTLVKKIENNESLDKLVVFTIDDNFKSFYKNGLPLFKKYNIPFTLFVYVESANRHYPDFMNWQEIKEASKYGEIGIHSYSHPHLATLSNKEIIKDTIKAINSFKKHLGYVPNMYAYPYGEYDNRVKKIINKFFKIICNQNPGAIDNTTLINDMDRIALTGIVNIEKKLKLKRLHIKDLNISVKNNIVKKISGFVNLKKLEIYITSLGWRWVRVKNGYFEYKPNFKLKRYRNRVIIRYNNKIISKLILKEEL